MFGCPPGAVGARGFGSLWQPVGTDWMPLYKRLETSMPGGLRLRCNLQEGAMCGAPPYSEIRMVDRAFGDDFSNKIGHGTTLGRSFQAFRAPTKI